MERFLNKITLGDCYELIKELPDKSVDCVYTDIPYDYDKSGGGGAFGSKNRTYRKEYESVCINTNGDGLGIDIVLLKEIVRVLKKVNCFIWCSKLQIFDIMSFFLNGDLNKEIYFEILTWNKTNPTPTTNNSWLPDIEYCLYFREKGVTYNDGYEYKSKWYISPANKNDKDLFSHPTIKPLPLVKRHLQHATQPNDIVLDCFMGSGTTAVACRETGRQFIGFEIETKWHKVANDRLDGITASGQMSFLLR